MAEVLSPTQSAALFDILTHYDTYAEIRDFRNPGSLKHYGPPFIVDGDDPSTSPALQTLVHRFLLTLPGLRDVPELFWKKQCYEIIENLEKANLSESYDKGVIGSRRTLATAISALIEYPVRGTFGGFPELSDRKETYDVTNAADISRAFRDFMIESIYGTVLEDLVEKVAQTDDLEEHASLTKAVHEFVLVNLASLMHYTLILSPKGQYLLKLVDNANKLVPYMVLKQTLRIGNVATMISGLVKVGLAKVSVATVTNFLGLTQNENEGMNLMQTIISTVLSWDNKELENRAYKIEHAKPKPSKQILQALKDYTTLSASEQEKIRKQSLTESVSIVAAILQTNHLSTDELSESQHTQALDYLSIQLSIRDRKQLIQCLCHGIPDNLTTSVRQLVDAYEPVIRRMHNAVDLSGTLGDFEYWLKDVIKLAKIHNDRHGNPIVPTVGDFVQLLRKHQRSCHVFMHQCCKNDRELTGWYLEWAQRAAAQFKRKDATLTDKGAGHLTPAINELYQSLPAETRSAIIPILDSHAHFLDDMHDQSAHRLAAVLASPASKNPAIAKILSGAASRPGSRSSSPAPPLDKFGMFKFDDAMKELKKKTGDLGIGDDVARHPSPPPPPPPPLVSSNPGPGAYLARWQALLDATPVTPLTIRGKAESAGGAAVAQASATDVDGQEMVKLGDKEAKGDKIRVEGLETDARKRQRDLKIVVDAMGEQFRQLLGETGKTW